MSGRGVRTDGSAAERVRWPQAVAVAAAAIAGVSTLFPACGGEERGGGSSTSSSGASGTSGAPTGTVGPTPPPVTLPTVTEIVDEADTPCTPMGGARSVVYTQAPSGTPVEQLSVVGARRLAQLADSTGFVLFDASGQAAMASAAEPFPSRNVAASTGSDVLALGVNSQAVWALRYDLQGAPVGSPFHVGAGEAEGLVATGGGGLAFAAWSLGRGGVVAASIGPTGAISSQRVTFEDGVGMSARAALGEGDTVGLFWSAGSETEGRTFFRRLRTSGPSPDNPRLIRIEGSGRRETRGVARTARGWVGLVDIGSVPHLLAMDDAGKPLGPIRRLRGPARSFGLAVSGDVVAVLAYRTEVHPNDADGGAPEVEPSEIEVRLFDPGGAPKPNGWLCIEKPATSVFVGGALLGEPDGFTAVYGGIVGATKLTRFDQLGAGVP